MAPRTMPPPARQWALATAGVLTQLNQHDQTLLGGGPPGPATAADRLAVLGRDWDAGTREQLLTTLGWLTREGHRKAFHEMATLDESKVEDDEARHKIRFARKHLQRIGPRGLLAWDAGRLVTVAGWGYVSQLLSEDEAWSYILPMAQAVQRSYSSWDELGKHYLLGFEFWSGSWEGRVARAHLAMFDDPASPWRTLPWGLDLSQHGLAVPLQTILLDAPRPPPPPPVVQAEPPKKSGKGLWVALGGAALLVVAGIGACFALGVFGKTAPPAPAPAATVSVAVTTATAPPAEPAHEPHGTPPAHASAHPGGSAHAPAPPPKKTH